MPVRCSMFPKGSLAQWMNTQHTLTNMSKDSSAKLLGGPLLLRTRLVDFMRPQPPPQPLQRLVLQRLRLQQQVQLQRRLPKQGADGGLAPALTKPAVALERVAVGLVAAAAAAKAQGLQGLLLAVVVKVASGAAAAGQSENGHEDEPVLGT